MSGKRNVRRLFGTDGIRGLANKDLTPELAFMVGFAVVKVLTQDSPNPRILIGRDTRCSGEMLEAALSAGIASAGGVAELMGIVPTPAVALLTRESEVDAGVVISASHNPAEDNGIKIFHSSGFKLPDSMEVEIERTVEDFQKYGGKRPHGPKVGRIVSNGKALDRYVELLLERSGIDLSGLKLVLDCAHGAVFQAGPRIFESCGAQVKSFFDQPDGYNINAGCGSTHPERIAELVVREGADLGLSFDGDADRVIAVDEKGGLINGDVIMALCANDLKERGLLKENSVVATVMSNKGFHLSMRQRGIKVYVTQVGDRYVLEELLKRDLNMGGEQSGHVIFLDLSPSGDGLITSLQLCKAWKNMGGRISEVAGIVENFPQVLLNVRVVNKELLDRSEALAKKIKEAEEALGEEGRVLIRPSGTEPLVRVMVEARSADEAERIARDLASIVSREFN